MAKDEQHSRGARRELARPRVTPRRRGRVAPDPAAGGGRAYRRTRARDELFVPADDEALAGVEHEDAEYDDTMTTTQL